MKWLLLLFVISLILQAWKKKTTNLNILLKSSENDDRVPLSSFLFYLVDGIIPLITESSLLTLQVKTVLKSINDVAAVSGMDG